MTPSRGRATGCGGWLSSLDQLRVAVAVAALTSVRFLRGLIACHSFLRVSDVSPAADPADFEDARKGLIASEEPLLITDDSGAVVWELESLVATVARERPETVHPSLWRQAELLAIHGLFEVVPGVYQVRGYDISNIAFIEGDEGVIVVDPLVSCETAAAALALYRRHRGERPVTGLIYSHTHLDHFGGARGVVDDEAVESGRVPVLAPQGFLEHAVAENVYAGIAMGRRAGYMFGALLDPGPDGQMTAGLGVTTSVGRVTLVDPTFDIVRTGQEETVDGVRFVFQLTPGTEAPAEMNFHLPELRTLFVAENASQTMHNLLTLRGALVRDPRIWARYLDEAIDLFGDASDAMFACHNWPRWGRERIAEFLAKQRDMYAYIHDQTLRLINLGYTGAEIAEQVELPPTLASEWHCHGFYGSVSHNVKAVYQRYMGWFDGNPAHLWQHPPEQAARRYVDYMGGAEAVLGRAREALEQGDLRWVAEVVNHVVFADPGNRDARELQAEALQRLGHGAENAIWRNFFLTGARELREGSLGTPTTADAAEIIGKLSLDELFDAMAIRLDGPSAWGKRIVVGWVIGGERWTITVDNGVLHHRPDADADADADATVRLERETFDAILLETTDPAEELAAGRIAIEGDGAKLGELLGLIGPVDREFAMVTP
jgi:linear primary-alkylsulfatase